MDKDKNYCTLYIIRHGQTEWNEKRILQGQLESSLTKNGIQQAKSLAQELKHIKFDAVYSSDLLRAKQTAEILALEHTLAIKTTELLRERKLGEYEGKPLETLQEINQLLKSLTHEKRFSYKPADDIESDEELVGRFITFLREAAVAHPNQTLLVTTHGGIMRAFLIHIGFGTYETLTEGTIANTAYMKLKSDGIDFFVEKTQGITKHEVKDSFS